MTELELERFDAVLFDLDGVLTDTAPLHAEAWKRMFDEFLRRWSSEHGHPFVPFSIDPDYLSYVDGKPRLEGVASFLESRRIVLPEGEPADPSDIDTIHALSNRKHELLAELIRDRGVEPFDDAIRFVHEVRDRGLATAVVSSSRNARLLLDAAGIDDLFDERVDGLLAIEMGLSGKPAPDTSLEAARRLEVAPGRAIVVEDAIVGVESGRLGGFGFVIGVDRNGAASDRLARHGADIVVSDLDGLIRAEKG